MTKSSAFRSEMYLPFLSLTMTSMLTRLDLTLTTSSSCAHANVGTSSTKKTIRVNGFKKSAFILVPSYTQRVGDPVDVIKPRSDECDLQNPLIIKTGRAQPRVIGWRDARRVARDLHHVIEHHLLLLGNRRLAVVVLERGHQLLVQRYSPQKLCVRLDSIMTTVGDRHHRRDHLMLSSRERQVRRHQRSKRRKRVIQRLRNQTVRRDDARRFAVRRRMHRRRILDRIQLTLRFDRLAHLFAFVDRNRLDPRHSVVLLSTKRLLRNRNK